jgi:hypothetical protein
VTLRATRDEIRRRAADERDAMIIDNGGCSFL